ncbi:MAG: hypothetical protein HUU15_09840 [Candidatus Brocadiae bacterium]|nr:hypothetical protein [Candidatus Brocadiia bacterium]
MRLPALALTFALAGLASARDPEWGGLGAVAVSPDGKTVVTGGASRVLYVLDAASMDVKSRIWIRARVGGLVFSRDGSRLFLEDDEETVHVYETAGWTETLTVADCGEIQAAPEGDLLVAIGSRPKPSVRFLSLSDGSDRGRVEVEGRIALVGIDPAGKTAFVLHDPAADAAEPKADRAAMPKDLKRAGQAEWQQRNDGQMATIRWIDVAGLKATGDAKLWYTARSGAHAFVRDGVATVVTYEDLCARITAKGEVSTFEVTGSYNYGRGSSGDRTWIAGGGLRHGALLGPDGAARKFEVDALPGWPEYWGGFTFGPDGTCWGVTSAFRLVRISKDGKVEKTVPVF